MPDYAVSGTRASSDSIFTNVPALRAIAGERALTKSLKRWSFALYLVFVAVYSIWDAAIEAKSYDPWVTGDWLINYSGGFVRRGFDGELAMLLHRAVGIPLNWVIVWMEASALLLFLICVFRLTKGMRWSYLMVVVLLSPAALAFTVLDRSGGLRKEFLLFAALGVTIWILISKRWKDWHISAVLSILLLILALSHEGMLVMGPYFFAAVLIQTRSFRRSARICAIPFVLTGIAVVAVLLHHGDVRQAQAICSSVGGQMAPPGVVLASGGVCTGAIAALQVTRAAERLGVVVWVHNYHLARLCGWLAIPTFAPVVLLLVRFYRRDGLRYEVVAVLACTLISLPGFAGLFYIGADWGRWLHMLVICLMLLAMMIDHHAAGGEESEWGGQGHGLLFRTLAILALVLYASAWNLPADGFGGETPGYIALLWPTYHVDLHRLRVVVEGRIRQTG